VNIVNHHCQLIFRFDFLKLHHQVDNMMVVMIPGLMFVLRQGFFEVDQHELVLVQ
jgi:hypothetical protein